MGILVAFLLCAVDSGVGELPAPIAEPPKLGVTLSLGVDLQWMQTGRIDNVAYWGELELSYRLLRWLRLELLTGGAWSPENRPSFPGQHGTFRALAGVDFVQPFRWGELFLGAAGGFQHTNLIGDEDYPAHPGYSSGWGSGPCLLVRGGVAFHVLENLALGGYLAYSLFLWNIEFQHSTEVRARFTLQF